MNTLINKLNAIDCLKENTEELYSIFKMVDGATLPIIRVTVPINANFVRLRSNPCVGQYNHVSELQYPPALSTGYGRANIPYNPMFYCCACSNININNEAAIFGTAIFESSKFATDINGIGKEGFTCSIWECMRNLSLLALPFGDNLEFTCNEIRAVQREWKSIIESDYVNPDSKGLIQYMSNEISKELHNKDYFKISNFVYWLLFHNESTRYADGIIYPSIKARGECLNIALKTTAVDEALLIKDVRMIQLSKRQRDMKCRVVQYGTINGRTIQYSAKQFSEKEILFFEKFDDGLNSISIINTSLT